MKMLFILSLVFGILGSISNDSWDELRRTSYAYVKLSDSVGFGIKLTNPAEKETDLLAIYVRPSMARDTTSHKGDRANFRDKLKQVSLRNGISWMDVYSRKDSIAYNNSTCYTKAEDIASAIWYVKNKLHLNKRIVLIGQSEGGMTNAMVASERSDISGVIFLSSPGVQGPQFLHYQDSIALRRFALTFGLHDNFWPFVYALSPVLGKTYSRDTMGIQAYYQDLAVPLYRIMDSYTNIDSIRANCMLYLQECWKKNHVEILKNIAKADSSAVFGFNNFLDSYRYKMYTMPQQIALYKWNPSEYLPKIECPVMAVFGTNDEKIEYAGSLKNMKALFDTGGNTNFTAQVLDGYNHVLQEPRGTEASNLHNDRVTEVVQWILQLPE